jgi:hypothetical protein
MYFMRKATVRKKRLPPIRKPDFLSRLIKLYKGKRMQVSGAELAALERGKGLFVS